MKRYSITALLCTLLLLGGCSEHPAPQQTAPPVSATPSPTVLPSSDPGAPQGLVSEYEYYHIDVAEATILLPKSWAEKNVVETVEGSDKITFAQKDYLSGEWGTREDGTEGPIPDPSGHHVPLALFRMINDADFLEDSSDFSDTEPSDSLFIWLGERNGIHYTLWFPTSFSAGDSENAEQKYEQYNAMCKEIEAYPKDASAYFIFDN